MPRKSPKNFEDALKRLETLTQSMQQPDLPLEQALAAYREGSELVHYCQNKLAEAEQQLLVLEQDELKELHLDPNP